MGADTAVESASEKLAQVSLSSSPEDHDDDDDNESIDGIEFVDYMDESQLESVMELVGRDLSEPYSTVSKDSNKEPIGCVVGKVDDEEVYQHGEVKTVPTGYIGMLAVSKEHRRKGIGKALVKRVVQRMKKLGCTSVTLETEVSNVTAQRLYQDSFGFIREELLVRYYLNFGDAYRLRLWFDLMADICL